MCQPSLGYLRLLLSHPKSRVLGTLVGRALWPMGSDAFCRFVKVQERNPAAEFQLPGLRLAGQSKTRVLVDPLFTLLATTTKKPGRASHYSTSTHWFDYLAHATAPLVLVLVQTSDRPRPMHLHLYLHIQLLATCARARLLQVARLRPPSNRLSASPLSHLSDTRSQRYDETTRSHDDLPV